MSWLSWQRWGLVFSVAAAMLCGAAAFGALVATAPQSDLFWIALAILSWTIVLPVGVCLLQRRPIHPLDPLWPFLVCYGISFVVKPLLDRSGLITYEWFRFDEASATVTILVATIALIVIYAGYSSGAHRLLLGALPRLRREPSTLRARTAALALTMGGVIAILAIYVSRDLPFSVTQAFAGNHRADVLRASYGHGYLTMLYGLASFAPAIQLVTALRTRRAADWLLWVFVTAAVFAVLMVIYSRQALLQVVISLVVVLHFRARLFGRTSIVVAGLVILLIGGFLGLRRTQGTHINPIQSFAFLGHTFDSFEFLTRALAELPPTGQLAGRSFVEDVTLTFIPRRIFPEKPDEFGVVRVQNLVAPQLAVNPVSSSTYPPGFLVEGYANFGAFGVFMVALVYGIGLRLAREWFWPKRERLFALLVYGMFILNMTAWFRGAGQFAIGTLFGAGLAYIVLCARIPVLPTRRTTATPHAEVSEGASLEREEQAELPA